MKKQIIIVALLFQALWIYGQISDDSIRQKVLENGRTDSLYIFGKWDENGGTETHLNYLGDLQTKEGTIKIMTSCWLWGISRRATNRILVFNAKDEYLGNFPVTTKGDLPEKIEDNRIIFLHNDNEGCDKISITKISFDAGIPTEFFVRCQKEYGDFYSFDKEN